MPNLSNFDTLTLPKLFRSVHTVASALIAGLQSINQNVKQIVHGLTVWIIATRHIWNFMQAPGILHCPTPPLQTGQLALSWPKYNSPLFHKSQLDIIGTNSKRTVGQILARTIGSRLVSARLFPWWTFHPHIALSIIADLNMKIMQRFWHLD